MSVNSDFFVSIYYLVVYLNLNKLVIDLGLIFLPSTVQFSRINSFLTHCLTRQLIYNTLFCFFCQHLFSTFLKSFVISNSFKSISFGWLRRSQQRRLFIILVLFDLSTPFFDFLNFFFWNHFIKTLNVTIIVSTHLYGWHVYLLYIIFSFCQQHFNNFFTII